MFDTKKFGGYLSRLRKREDMTQSELADKLSLTRQAVSKYETGDSFPDVSILVLIADIFGVTLDDLINAGEPSRGEAVLLAGLASGHDDILAQSVSDVVGLAPLLKPSILNKLSAGFAKQGISIASIVSLAEYLSDDAVVQLLEHASFESIGDELLQRLIPFLDDRSKGAVFQKILDGSMDWHFIRVLLPYAEYMLSPIEAAVVEGALPWEALDLVHEALRTIQDNRRRGEL